MSRSFSLILFLVLVVGGGLLIGVTFTPGEGYDGLVKPSYNPPNWIFGPVWTILYVMMAITGWRTWHRSRHGRPMMFWWLQLVLNFAWTPVFFGLRQPALALAVIVALATAVSAFKGATWRTDRLSSALTLPYLLWVIFAAVLNGAIVWLN